MRLIGHFDTVSILELRGGTHLVLIQNADMVQSECAFDLMVEDIDRTHADLTEKGLAPTRMTPGRIHKSFYITEPAGNTIKFNSSHVSDLPV